MVPLFVGFQMQKRATFFWSDDVDGTLLQPIASICRKSTHRVHCAMGLVKTMMVRRLSSHAYLHGVDMLLEGGRFIMRENLLPTEQRQQQDSSANCRMIEGHARSSVWKDSLSPV